MKIFFKFILFFSLSSVLISNSYAEEIETTIQDSTIQEIPIRLLQEEFMYANSNRHTITGILPNRETKIKPVTFGVISGLTVGFLAAQHIVQVNTIWSETTEFRFIEDGQYALYSDKAGHFFGCYLSSYSFTEGFLASGLNKRHATWVGASMGLLYSGYIEVMDGFGTNWGFSPSDFYANFVGASFYVLQEYYPYLQNVTPKFTYLPPRWHNEFSRKEAAMFIDDYSAHTLWLSFNVHNMLPDNLKNYWPQWLGLSVGYAARNLCAPGSDCNPDVSLPISDVAWGDRKWILALDYDLTKIIPDCGPFCNWMVQTINLFKFPAPGIEFGDSGTRFMLFYPFPIYLK